MMSSDDFFHCKHQSIHCCCCSLLESICCFVVLVVVVVLFIVLFNMTVVENIFNNKFGYSSKHYRSVNQLLLLYDSSICYGSKESKLEHVYKIHILLLLQDIYYILYYIFYSIHRSTTKGRKRCGRKVKSLRSGPKHVN